MVLEDGRLDELILQVFEEHEDQFFWPVASQKEAKNFVKCIHDKGAPYEEICREIDEFEHNFSAWRKGLGRVGIGSRMIERINKTVESVIESDDEDSLEFNLRQLAKVNKKHDSKSKSSPEKTPTPSPTKDPKQQQADLTSSMMRNIDKHTQRNNTEQDSTPAKSPTREEATPVVTPAKKEPAIVNGNVSPTKQTTLKQEPVVAASRKEEAPVKKEPEVRKEEVTKTETTSKVSPQQQKEEIVPKVETKTEVKTEVVKSDESSLAAKSEEVTSSRRRSSEETKEETEEKEAEKKSGDRSPDPEVDEVKKKMEAIRKKVELMKKQKAEKAQQQSSGGHPPPEAETSAAPESSPSPASVQSPSAAEGDKYDAMRKKLENLRSKIRTEDGEEDEVDGAEEEAVPPKPTSRASKPEATTPTKAEPEVPPPKKPEVTKPKTPEPKLEPELTVDVITDLPMTSNDDENYDSDLDPENYDSDLEYDLYKDVNRLASQIDAEKSRQRARDGPGHLYIFSDSPAGDRSHRVKVGATRNPDRKFAQAQSFNPSFKRVSCTAVTQRKRALRDVHRALEPYRLDDLGADWFSGPVDRMLQAVSTVTEKYGSGSALASFQTQSQC